MRKLSTPGALLFAGFALAQCPFNPTILPDGLILCPNEQDQLTTQVYESYQWYKEGVAIPGAIFQTLIVDADQDAGYSFSVEATMEECTEMSPSVLVDGYAFLFPYVIHEGDPPLYIEGDGIAHHCTGDTVILIFSYQDNVQWTNNGAPIPGATDDTLIVTTTGNYSCSGAPAVCPDFIMGLGLTISLVFDVPVQPVILESVDQICADPEGIAYAWYLDGVLLLEDSACITPASPGLYTVDVTYDPDCSIPSEPFIITGVGGPADVRPSVSPMPANDQVTITWPAGRQTPPWQLIDASGRAVMKGGPSAASILTLDLSGLESGSYWLHLPGARPLPVTVVK